MSLNTPLLPALTLLGNAALLQQPALAIFCSSQAPAGVLLRVHDLAQRWRHEESVIMGGFQSSVEQEALTAQSAGRAPLPFASGCLRMAPQLYLHQHRVPNGGA